MSVYRYAWRIARAIVLTLRVVQLNVNLKGRPCVWDSWSEAARLLQLDRWSI